jgi:hypothetical protein
MVQNGWVQGQGRDHLGNVCAGQAIVNAWQEHYGERFTEYRSYGHPTYERAVQVFVEAMTTMYGTKWEGSIPDWNDHPSRTKAQVIATFDRAISSLRVQPVEKVVVPTPRIEVIAFDKDPMGDGVEDAPVFTLDTYTIESPEPKPGVIAKIRDLVGV